jgi:hypothetical protein
VDQIRCYLISGLAYLFLSQEYKQDNVKKQHGEGITEGAFISTIMVLILLSII